MENVIVVNQNESQGVKTGLYGGWTSRRTLKLPKNSNLLVPFNK